MVGLNAARAVRKLTAEHRVSSWMAIRTAVLGGRRIVVPSGRRRI